jgi:hypothetical protein
MKFLFKSVLFFTCLGIPAILFAQKDSVWLQCPLNEAMVVPPPKNVIHYDEPDMCVVLSSKPDTSVKACTMGKVSNIEKTEDGKYGVVYYYKDYYFWYTNLETLLVRKNENIQAGQVIGTISKGTNLELMLFKFETPVDVTRFLGCKSVLNVK